VDERERPLTPLWPGMRLAALGDGRWQVLDGERPIAEYRWEELRFSISWKAYCFADEAERRAWREHQADLSVASVLDRLLADLAARGVIRGTRPSEAELPDLLIDTYVRYPAPVRAA